MLAATIVDNGGANLASVVHALERLGARARLAREADDIRRAGHVILPGIGAAGEGMRRLRARGLDDVLRERQGPLLGVCLGLQLLFEASEENETRGLELLPGTVRRLPDTEARPVPHMGWNRLAGIVAHPVLRGIDETDWFYFVHAYAAPRSEFTIARCEYGASFTAVAAKDAVVAVQFHPEKSAAAGARLLKNFLEWRP